MKANIRDIVMQWKENDENITRETPQGGIWRGITKLSRVTHTIKQRQQTTMNKCIYAP